MDSDKNDKIKYALKKANFKSKPINLKYNFVTLSFLCMLKNNRQYVEHKQFEPCKVTALFLSISRIAKRSESSNAAFLPNLIIIPTERKSGLTPLFSPQKARSLSEGASRKIILRTILRCKPYSIPHTC